MATPAQEKVHVEVAGFAGYGEFHGSNKDCSADAELMARHPLDGSPLDAATLNLWWSEYWNTGHHTSGGATLDHIYWHLTGSAHKLDASKARVARYIPVDTIPIGDLRTAMIAALVKGQTVIVYLGNAQALTYNERGVYGHFIALGGIDSDQGYLVGNGDDVNALGGKGIIPTRWYGWNMLAAAQINGMIALEKVEATNMGVPSGWKDDGKTLVAPNGVPVVRGFRLHVLNGWDAYNWPMKPEVYLAQIEPGNVAMGRGSRQDFRLSSLGCQQHADGSWGGVYHIYVGQDILALETQLAAAQEHVSALEEQVKQLQNQPAPVPVVTPPDPKSVEALAALVELAKALKLLEAMAA
jgi:hypothetical protein